MFDLSGFGSQISASEFRQTIKNLEDLFMSVVDDLKLVVIENKELLGEVKLIIDDFGQKIVNETQQVAALVAQIEAKVNPDVAGIAVEISQLRESNRSLSQLRASLGEISNKIADIVPDAVVVNEPAIPAPPVGDVSV
jgi:hypothetical protein